MCPNCYRPEYDCRCHDRSPAAPVDERYLTLTSQPRQRMLGVAPNSQTLTYLTSAQGFVVDDGSGSGQFIVKAPTWQLAYVNPASANVYPNSGTFTSIMVCGDAEGQPWQMVHAPTAGSFFLQCVNGVFGFYDSGQIPGLNSVFANAASATSVEALGFIQTGTTGGGAPIFATRKLTSSGTNDQFLVLHFNSTTGRYEITATTDATALTRGTISARNWIGLDSDGDPITDGFDVRPSDATLANFALVMYDKAAHRLYRAPGPTAVNKSITAPVTVSGATTYVTVFDFGTVAFTYPAAMVQFAAGWNHNTRTKWGLYLDGVLQAEWDYTQVTADVATPDDNTVISAGNFIVTTSVGNHSVVIKAQHIGSGDRIVESGTASLFCIAG